MAMMTKNEDFYQDSIKILTKFNLPTTIDLTRQELLKYINNDKKKTNTDTIKIVLLKKIGQAYLKTIRISISLIIYKGELLEYNWKTYSKAFLVNHGPLALLVWSSSVISLNLDQIKQILSYVR